MYVLKLLRIFSVIALVQQGLFFSLSAAEASGVRIPVIADRETPIRHSPTKGNGVEFSDGNSCCEQARQYTQKGLIDLAIPELKKTIRLHPDNVEAHAYLGWAYSQKELLSDAVEEFQKVLQINPDLQKVPFDYPMMKFVPSTVKEITASFQDMIDKIDEFPGAHAVLGLYYVLQGRLGDALNEYKKVLRQEPSYGKREFIIDGKKTISVIDQAITEYEEVLKSKPDYADAYSKLACAYAEKGMLDLSIANIKKVISLEPDRVEPHVYLGCFYAKKWMPNEALKELAEAKKIRDNLLERLLVEAERCLQDCMFDKAISGARDAIKVYPENKKAYWLLAMAYSKGGKMDEAIEIYKKIICLYPDDICAYTLLGWIYVQCDLLEEADDLVEQAIHRKPENAEIQSLKAFISASQNLINKAITACKMALENSSGKNTMIKNYGWVKGKVPSMEQKFSEVRDTLEIQPDYPEAYMCLGWLYSKNGENEKAITSFRKAVELMPGSYNAHLYLGNRYAQKGEIRDALTEYNKAAEILSIKVQNAMTQGLASFNAEDTERAIDCFNNALKMNPEYEEAYFLLANAYEKKGLYSVGMVLRSEGERLKQRADN